ncbi:MAG: hypothetical protein IKS17_08055 [Firmicutes bacterium]|nr:hypothetical protein [Bacillota bacterium]
MSIENTAFRIGMIVGAVCVGIITGLIPLIVGLRKDKTGLAIGGFFSCLVSGLLLGLILALPCCGVFTYLILKEKKEEKPDDM